MNKSIFKIVLTLVCIASVQPTPSHELCRQVCFNLGFNIKMGAPEDTILHKTAEVLKAECKCTIELLTELINENAFCRGFCQVLENWEAFPDKPEARFEAEKAIEKEENCDCSNYDNKLGYENIHKKIREHEEAKGSGWEAESGFDLFDKMFDGQLPKKEEL